MQLEPAVERPKRKRYGGNVAKKHLFRGEWLTYVEIAKRTGKSEHAVSIRLLRGLSMDDEWISGKRSTQYCAKTHEGKSYAEIARGFGISEQLFRSRVNKLGIETALAMAGTKISKEDRSQWGKDGRMEKLTECKCPCCGKRHELQLYWVGVLPARKLCYGCSQIHY